MKKEFYKQLDHYLNDKLSLNDLVHNLKILDRKRFVQKSNSLLNDIDPRLKKLFDQLKPNVEELTNLKYAGCYNSLENTTADFKNYILRFKDNYGREVNISLGSFASSGSGDYEKYIKYDNMDHILKFGYMTPSCHYTGGELDINDENVLMNSLSKIIYFCYDNLSDRKIEQKVKIFLDNFGKVSNKEILDKLNEY